MAEVDDSGDIYWDALCGNESVNDAFWSDSLTVNTSQPQLTLCFQMTILTWIPNVFLFAALLPYVIYLSDERVVHRIGSISKLNLAKMILTSLILMWETVGLVYSLTRDDDVMLATVSGLGINIIGVLTALVLTYWIFRRGQHTSGVLLVYWILTLVCATLALVSNTTRYPGGTKIMSALEYPYYAFLCILLLLTIPSDEVAKSVTRGMAGLGDDERKPLLGDGVGSRRGSEYTRKYPCPKQDASFLSILFYGWYFPIVGTGYKRTLVYDDIWDLRESDTSYVNVNGFMDAWEEELIKNGYPIDVDNHPRVDGKTRGNPSIWRVMRKNWGWLYAGAGLLQVTESCLELVNPLLMNVLIDFVGGNDSFIWHGYLLAVCMFLTSMMSVLLLHQSFDISYNIGLRVRTAVIGAIYRKATKLAVYSGGATSAGAITNLMSVDAQKMQDLFPFLHYMWISPIIIGAGTYLLWGKVGVASLAGIAFYAIVIPSVAIISSKFIRSMQVAQMHLKDARLKLMNQILNGIKVLKLYAWEEYFEKRIQAIRKEEIDYLKNAGILSTSTMTISSSASFLASLMTFITYLFTVGNGILSPDVAFVSLSLLNALSFPIIILPNAIQSLIQGVVSIKRIRDFLLAEEVDPSCVTRNFIDEGAITVNDGVFSWGEHERIILKDINVSVETGSLVAVVGSVGSGKTSFVSAMLGEMFLRRGSVNIDGTIAYVPQQAWIQNMTLRDNILFAKPYSRQKYQDILDACALTDDLKILSAGDMTEIGERGINVSGGQKQRISLARAVYQNSDIYLLDDPLSAVDAHVGKHIFDKVIGPHGSLRNKTRVLVTNGVNFLPQTDKIIVLKDNGISEMGTFDELISRKGAFAEFIAQYLQEMAENEDDEDIELQDEETKALLRRLSSIVDISLSLPRPEDGDRRISGDGVRRRSSRRRRSTLFKQITEDKEEKKKDVLVQEEIAEEGNIKMAVIKKYIDSANMSYAILAAIGIVLAIGGSVGSNVWLSDWSNDSFLSEEEAKEKIPLRLGIYSLLGVASAMGNLLVLSSVVYGTLTASLTMHTDMLNNVLKSPMSFFDTTPLGRLINRFSKDIDTMDVELRMYIQMWLNQMAPVIATIIVIIYSTPIFIAVVIPLLILFAILQRVYVKTARQIKRIDSIKRTPVFNNFSETLNGISSIRAYGQQERFIENADMLLDNNQKVWFAVYSSNRWIGVVAQNLGNLVVFFAAIFCVVSRDTMDPGVVGMSLTFALQVGMQIVLVVRTTCELENYIVSVERVSEYIETPQEAPWNLPGKRTPEGWPAAGAVEFQEYCTRYRAGLDLVLTGVDCQVKPGEKIGIVGRTGAGKSSMTLALFRIIEAAGGAIMIDDVNIANLGLHQIRSKLTIIPQDPVVFSGSLRLNIDPAEAYSDGEVWTALEQAHLKPFVSTLSEGLYYECGEEGQNLSVGQRQLVCLARALLRRTKILILDEATAAIDLETDDLIQNTIRTAFKDCTVLTIAHRLNTIMDSDRVMVLDKGKVKEFMSPNKLLADETTIFYGMAKDAGLV